MKPCVRSSDGITCITHQNKVGGFFDTGRHDQAQCVYAERQTQAALKRADTIRRNRLDAERERRIRQGRGK